MQQFCWALELQLWPHLKDSQVFKAALWASRLYRDIVLGSYNYVLPAAPPAPEAHLEFD